MTRAADRLIVCGAENRTKRPDGCWYNLIHTALEPFLVEEGEGEDKVFRYRKTPDIAAEQRAAAAGGNEKVERPKLPSWLRESAPAETRRAEPLSPSAVFDDEIGRTALAAAGIADRQKALQRGRIVHRLMQALPDIPPELRRAAADRYLASAAKDFLEAERAAMATQMFAILSDPRFAEVFTPGSRPEVPIVGRIARAGAKPILVAGQVDRLIVTADTVLIADYKTDSYVPQKLDEVGAYVTQLALYRAVLASLYSGKTVRAALIFTAGPVLMELPADTLDAALSEVVTKNGHAAVMAP
jgi:ATP-dependent helicase/nuclease subunit A